MRKILQVTRIERLLLSNTHRYTHNHRIRTSRHHYHLKSSYSYPTSQTSTNTNKLTNLKLTANVTSIQHNNQKRNKLQMRPLFLNQTEKRHFSDKSNNDSTNNSTIASDDDIELANLHSSHRMREREKLGDIIEGSIPHLQTVKHPQIAETIETTHDIYEFNDQTEFYTLAHPIWTESQTKNVVVTHHKPTRLPDYLAYYTVQTLRLTWDITTGYILGRKLGLFKFSYNLWLLRICYLETVAGVPGMMFGMVRHLNSLRQMRRDHGWIHTLLAEAENERMHLLTFLKLYEPSTLFRYGVVIAQFLMSNFLMPCYLISPRFCHKFVGYLEEEAVKTYTGLLEDIDAGLLPEFEARASKIARDYWQLSRDATWKEVILQVRADEAHHREVNHTLAPLSAHKVAPNPFRNNDTKK